MKERHERHEKGERSNRRSLTPDRHRHHHHHHRSHHRSKNGRSNGYNSDNDTRDRRRSQERDRKSCKKKRKLQDQEDSVQQRNLSPSPPPRKRDVPIPATKEPVPEKWGKEEGDDKKKVKENIAKPDFGLSGKLAEEVNTYNGVVIKYSEPPEARKPKRRWRLYPFKGDDVLPTLYIHRQSAYLIGRDRKVADLPIDHPSCSKQHAVLQYRIVPYTREDGTKARRIRPYIIDLESANGTYINNNRIDAKKYVELLERDVIKFAYSSREYVLLHEHSQDDRAEEDDNVGFNEEEAVQ